MSIKPKVKECCGGRWDANQIEECPRCQTSIADPTKEKLNNLSERAKEWLYETCNRFAEGEGYSTDHESIAECLEAGLIEKYPKTINIPYEIMGLVYSENFFHQNPELVECRKRRCNGLEGQPDQRCLTESLPPAVIALGEAIKGECLNRHTIDLDEPDWNDDYTLEISLTIGEIRAFIKALEQNTPAQPHNG